MLKFLFVCTQGRHRSRTAAERVRNRLGTVESRYAGVAADADLQVSEEDVNWADVIVCMEQYHRNRLRRRFRGLSGKIQVWNIPDEFVRGEPALVAIIDDKLGLVG